MKRELTPLLFEGEHLVRTTEISGEIWFIAADVCRILGIKNVSDAVDRLDEDEKTLVTSEGSTGPGMNAVSEPGVYRLVFPSRKPIAERLKRWLAHDVIPSIRKTGSYSATASGEVIAPAAEARPFPDWTLEEMRTKGGVVNMYRLNYGPMSAQWIAPQLGFPSPPIEMVEHGRQYTMTLAPSGGGQ